MDIAVICAKQVIGLFIIIFIGAVAYKAGVIKKESSKILADILLYIIVPAMILDSYMVEFDTEKSMNLIKAFGISTLLIAVAMAFVMLVFAKYKDIDKRIMMFGCIFSNAGYMGFPLIKAMFGDEGLLYASAYLTMFNVFVWTIGYVMITGKNDAKEAVKIVATNPVIMAVIIGLIIYFGRIPIPDVVKNPIGMVGDMNTPISMIIIGMTIASSKLMTLIKNKKMVFVIAMRLLVIPILSIAGMYLLQIKSMVVMVALVLQACPCAAVTTMFAIKFNHNEQLASGAVVFSTLLSIITLPIYVYIIAALGLAG